MKIEIIEKLFTRSTSKKEMIRAFSVFKITKDNYISLLILLILSLIAAFIISIGNDTIRLFLQSVDAILDILLALFGIIFMGYTIFQAILNEKMLIKMLENTDTKDKEEKSILQISNESFIGLMMLNILGILVSYFLKLILGGIDREVSLFSSDSANILSSGILCTLYFYYVAVIIWEMKSFVFNIFQLFNAYSGARMIEILEKRLYPIVDETQPDHLKDRTEILEPEKTDLVESRDNL